MIIRQQTRGRRSLDDFCRSFLGGDERPAAGQALHLRRRGRGPERGVAPTTGGRSSTRGSSAAAPRAARRHRARRLAARLQRERDQLLQKTRRTALPSHRLPLLDRPRCVDEDGEVQDAIPGSPAARAGLAPGMKVIAVNGRASRRTCCATPCVPRRHADPSDRKPGVFHSGFLPLRRRSEGAAPGARRIQARAPGSDPRAAKSAVISPQTL